MVSGMITKLISGNQMIYYIVTFLLLHTTFFTLEHVHYKYCVPSGFSGYLHSMFSSNSPPCVTLRWISTSLSTSIISLISLAGPVIISSITTAFSFKETT